MYDASSRNKSTPTGLEYCLIVIIIAVSAIAILRPLGLSVGDLFHVVSGVMTDIASS